MKPIETRTAEDLRYTDPVYFVEALLTSKNVVPNGSINEEKAEFNGSINLNLMTSEVQRYLSAKVNGALEIAKETPLVSQLHPEEKCDLNFFHSGEIKECVVKAVRFSRGKVKYDVAIQVTPSVPEDKNDQKRWTVIKNVDSIYVQPVRVYRESNHQ